MSTSRLPKIPALRKHQLSLEFTNASSEDPVSASDEERLPPGGFSLRHGFPHWFGRGKRNVINSADSSRAVSINGFSTGGDAAGKYSAQNPNDASRPTSPSKNQADNEREESATSTPAEKPVQTRENVPVTALLDYIRSTFDDETVLDSLPLEAAGNPSAWHAWKAHRKDSSNSTFKTGTKRGIPQARLPGDWHWDGIWAKRVQDEVEASHSEATLFGNATRSGGAEDSLADSFFSVGRRHADLS
ncbi:hypothetical protein APSETT444_008491 [Aspergillus pseudonomiae]